MSDTAVQAEHTDAHEGHDDHEHGLSDLGYVKVAIALAIITALEVYASYADWLGRAFIPLLLFLMVVKFVSVVLYFMHLKFDSRLFSIMFYLGLVLAIGVYGVTLFVFRFWDG